MDSRDLPMKHTHLAALIAIAATIGAARFWASTAGIPCMAVGEIALVPEALLPLSSSADWEVRGNILVVGGLPLVVLDDAGDGGANNKLKLKRLSPVEFWTNPRVRELSGCSPVTARARCQRVVDGDTIKLEGGERVRYIGIDTPETKHPTKPVEAFGREASARNQDLVEGRVVTLEYGVSHRDQYGRLLAYVYVDGQMVNAQLVAEGYAHASPYSPNLRYVELFRYLQRRARQSRRGLWGSAAGTDGRSHGQNYAQRPVAAASVPERVY